MSITIAIPTWNRCETLGTTLDCLCRQELPEGLDVELIVVLNACTDASRETAEGYIHRFPGEMRVLDEPEPGTNNARNRALRESRMDVIAFTDDDVLVDLDWIARIYEPFSEPDVEAAGGRVLPRGEVEFPDWFDPRDFPGVLVNFDLGDEPFDLELEDPHPAGANMAFRRKRALELGGFRNDLDRIGEQLLAGGDTHIFVEIREKGGTVRYLPKAIVHHPIPLERLNRKYVHGWHEGAGVGWARIFFEKESGFPHFLGVPRHRLRSWLEHLGSCWMAVLGRRPDRAFYHRMQMVYQSAFCREYRKMRKIRKREKAVL